MSEVKIRHQNDRKKAQEQELLLDDFLNELMNENEMEDGLNEDPNTFMLNNLLMSVQFFENYERDVRRLRENWFKELSLDSHHKKCFYADSLFRLSAASVKFSAPSTVNENSESPLRPFRIYVSSNNMEAAFDSAALGRNPLEVWPEYQFRVRKDDKFEKTGCIFLIESKTIREPTDSKHQRPVHPFQPNPVNPRNSFYIQNKTNFSEKSTRRLTKTEMSLVSLNKQLLLKVSGKRCSMQFISTPDDTIPVTGFYKLEDEKTRLKPKMIYDVRMNSMSATSHEIPQLCYQYEERRNNSRRLNMNELFITERVLNSAAYKGYFCDLLTARLAEPLHLDSDAVNDSTVLEEFITVNDRGTEYCIAPVIPIRDWTKFILLKRPQFEKSENLVWPSVYMQRIMQLLPCHVVPTWHSAPSSENLNYEKLWKIVFPKTEEFLLLHMMHAHIRCYFFVLLLYKSFIEPEIDGVSLGPTHLMHLLFWKVHRNFLEWPEDRPAETLLNYLKTLYRKLQNKYLPDFFITSRNLFATSFPKDLHMAQTLIKKILENPTPYVIRALGHLRLRHDFYPDFDYPKLNEILKPPPQEKNKKKLPPKKRKQVRFQDDEEQHWKQMARKQMEVERKAEEENVERRPFDLVNVKEIMNFDSVDGQKSSEILQLFSSHFLKMGSKSMEYNSLSQGLMYLSQTQKLLQLMITRGLVQDNLKEIQEKIKQLMESCCGKIQRGFNKLPGKPKQFRPASQKQDKNLENSAIFEKRKETETTKVHQEEILLNGEDSKEEDKIISIKL